MGLKHKNQAERVLPFIRSSAVYTATAFVVSLLNYYFNLYLARTLSLSDYGEYMSALSYVLLLSVPISALSMALIKRIGRTRKSDRWLVGLSIESWTRSLLWRNKLLILGGGLALIVLLSIFRLQCSSAVAVLVLWLMATQGAVYPAIFQASRRFLWVSLLLLLVTLCKISGLWLIPSSQQLLFIYLLLFVASGTQIGIGSWLLRKFSAQSKNTAKPVLLSWSLMSVVKRRSVYLPALSSLGLLGMITLDIIVAKIVISSEQVGLYAGLSLLAKILLYLTAPLTAVAYAYFSGSETKKDSKLILILCVILIIIGTFIVSNIYTFFPAFITSIFLDSAYLPLGSSLRMAAIFGGLYSIATLLTQFFIARGSRLGLLSLAAVVIQIVGILLFHNSLTQVMLINSIVVFLLCVGYAIGLVIKNTNSSSRIHETK